MKHVFLILKFIYSANLKGQILRFDDFPLDQLNLTEDQLNFYVKNLYEENYIKGIFLIPMYGGKVEIKLNNPTITIKGIEYLEDNSAMKKAYAALKELKSWIP